MVLHVHGFFHCNESIDPPLSNYRYVGERILTEMEVPERFLLPWPRTLDSIIGRHLRLLGLNLGEALLKQPLCHLKT